MMIYMLAAAMTIAMLIATAFALHQETERRRLNENRTRLDAFRLRQGGFGPRL